MNRHDVNGVLARQPVAFVTDHTIRKHLILNVAKLATPFLFAGGKIVHFHLDLETVARLTRDQNRVMMNDHKFLSRFVDGLQVW